MRIAMVSEHYYPHPGGVSEHLYNLSNYLTERGHTVKILTGRWTDEGRGPSPAPPGVEVVHLGAHNVPLNFNGGITRVTVGVGTGQQLRTLFGEERFDVIHVHAPLFPMLPLLAVKYAPASSLVVGTMHSVFGASAAVRLARPYLQRCINAMDGIISVAPNVLSAHEKVGLHYKDDVIPNGIDLRYWRAGKPMPQFDDGKINLMVLALLVPRNQIELIFEALPLIKAEHPAVRLIVVGDGPERPRLEAIAATWPESMRGDVFMAGNRILDRNDFAASSHIFCFTHSLASLSVSLLEGMAAGLPIVCQDMEFTRKAIDEGVEGLHTPRGDVQAYASAIVRLCRDEALRRKMGAAAQKRVEPYGWHHVGSRIESKYLDLLAQRGL